MAIRTRMIEVTEGECDFCGRPFEGVDIFKAHANKSMTIVRVSEGEELDPSKMIVLSGILCKECENKIKIWTDFALYRKNNKEEFE